MKAYFLLAPLSAALVAGCAIETVYTRPAAVVAAAPAYVAPSTVVLPSTIDSDGDGWSNAADRYPYDGRFR